MGLLPLVVAAYGLSHAGWWGALTGLLVGFFVMVALDVRALPEDDALRRDWRGLVLRFESVILGSAGLAGAAVAGWRQGWFWGVIGMAVASVLIRLARSSGGGVIAPDPGTAPSQPVLICTRVHGTWGHAASWILPGSSIEKAVEETLRGVPVLWLRFDWSGYNRQVDREAAADRLARHICSVGAAHTGIPHVVVGHSHGGNVALRALQNESARALVSKLVLIGTPLFVVTPRDVSRMLAICKYTLPFLAAFGILAVGVSIGDALNLHVLVALFTALFALGAFAQSWEWTRHGAAAWVARRQESAARQWTSIAPDGVPVVCAWTPMDEAAGLLTATGRAARVPVRLWEFARNAWGWTFLPASLVILLLVIGAVPEESPLIMVPGLVFFVYPVLLTIGLAVVSLFARSRGLFLGLTEMFLAPLLVDVSVNQTFDTPQARHSNANDFEVRFDHPEKGLRGLVTRLLRGGLYHSRLYLDPGSVKRIAEEVAIAVPPVPVPKG